MVFDHEGEYGSQWAAIRSIAEKVGCSSKTLRNWARRAETDAGRRPRPSSAQLEELRLVILAIGPCPRGLARAWDNLDRISRKAAPSSRPEGTSPDSHSA